MRDRLLSVAIYGLSTALGVAAFLYPFFMPAVRSGTMSQAHGDDAPLLLTGLVVICIGALLVEVQGQAGSAKMVALLGMLVSINALLRFVEVAVPGPGGFSPIFFLIVVTGYVFGGRLGFLMGALTLLVSALITAGMGPWLPYQMFTAGWIGLSAPLCRPVVRAVGGEGRWGEVWVLAVFGGIWGLVYGGVMNLWFWPYAAGSSDQYWQPGMGILDVLQRYAAFYVTTSLVWDIMALVGNLALVLAFGQPTLRALRRFRRRFAFRYSSVPGTAS